MIFSTTHRPPLHFGANGRTEKVEKPTGEPALLGTGTDEHGMKVFAAANTRT